jgi:hypothetical protein
VQLYYGKGQGDIKPEIRRKRSSGVEERRLGNIYGFDGGNYAGNVYDGEGLAPTIRTFQGGGTTADDYPGSKADRQFNRKCKTKQSKP